MTLGDLLKSRRTALGLTLEEVGDAAGLSKSHLHGLESGRNPNPGIVTCARLSLALGMSVTSLAAAAVETAMSSGKEAPHG